MTGRENKYVAFEELFTLRFHQLYVHALSYVEDEECAKDIVHDVFTYLWEHFDDTDHTHLLALLYRLVHNRCIDQLRHHQATRHYIEEVYNTAEGEACIEINYKEYDPRLVRIRKGIEELPPQTRRVFIECVLHKKSYKETAELFGISPLTVKTLVARALKTLRKQTEFFSPFLVLLFSTLYAI